jgi:hypothetical protein
VIRTGRGLVILAALAVALALAVVVAGRRAPVVAGGGLLVDEPLPFDAIRVEYGPASVRVERDATRAWVGTEPVPFAADTATIDSVRFALRGAKWHRRASASAAGAIRGRVTTFVGERGTTIGIGQELAGAGQTWVVIDDHAYLVESWVVTALWPSPLALRDRTPFARAAAAGTIAFRSRRIERTKLLAPDEAWLDTDLVGRLHDALADLTIVGLDGMTKTQPGESIQLGTTTVARAGTCANGRVMLAGTMGDGCVEAAAWQRVIAALDVLDKPIREIADRRPMPVPPTALTWGSAPSTQVVLVPRPLVDTDDADPVRIAELLGALQLPAALVVRPSAPQTSVIRVDAVGGGLTLSLYPDGSIARDDETFALHPTPEASAIIARPPSSLRDPILWREDVTSIVTLAIDGVTYKRGQVIGEWLRTPGAATLPDAALIESLVSTLAIVRAPAGLAPTRIAHRITVTIETPTDAPKTHTLELGPPTAAGCAARVDRMPVVLELALCTAAVALAAAR